MRIGIIGGGATGLSSAYFLLKSGHDVTIFEKESSVGGLAGSIKVGNSHLERFYHHFFLSDKDLISLAREIGIGDRITKKTTLMGFYVNKKLYNFSTPVDLLFFTPIPFIDRIRQGLMILYLQKTKQWQHLDSIKCETWIRKFGAKKTFEVIWKPLLITKFGKNYNNIPATFLWGRIHPRSQSREGLKEKLCYFKQGYYTFFSRLEQIVKDLGAKIIHCHVEKIDAKSNTLIKVVTPKSAFTFDKVIFTASNYLFLKIVDDLPKKYVNQLKKIKYMGIVCMLLKLKKPLSKYYWINISDKNIPFGGIIEHTNFIPKDRYGCHLVYIFNYANYKSKLFKMESKDIFKLYLNGIKRIFPAFKNEDVIDYVLSKNPFATPIYDMNYMKKMPNLATPIKNIYMVNMTQTYPEDRNVSHCIRLAKKVTNLIKKEHSQSSQKIRMESPEDKKYGS